MGQNNTWHCDGCDKCHFSGENDYEGASEFLQQTHCRKKGGCGLCGSASECRAVWGFDDDNPKIGVAYYKGRTNWHDIFSSELLRLGNLVYRLTGGTRFRDKGLENRILDQRSLVEIWESLPAKLSAEKRALAEILESERLKLADLEREEAGVKNEIRSIVRRLRLLRSVVKRAIRHLPRNRPIAPNQYSSAPSYRSHSLPREDPPFTEHPVYDGATGLPTGEWR